MPTTGNASLAFDLAGSHVINQGASYALVIVVRNTDGTAYDFGTYNVRAQIRAAKSTSSALLATFTPALDTPDIGSVALSLDAEQTTALGADRSANKHGDAVCIGWYDVEVYNPADPTDVPLRLAQGRVFLDLNVTE